MIIGVPGTWIELGILRFIYENAKNVGVFSQDWRVNQNINNMYYFQVHEIWNHSLHLL